MHDASVASQTVVGGAEGLLSGHFANPGTDDANDDGGEGTGTGVANNAEPGQLGVGAHLGGTVDDPGTHTTGEEGESDGPGITGVASGEEEVGSTAGVKGDATGHLAGGTGAGGDSSIRFEGRRGRCHTAGEEVGDWNETSGNDGQDGEGHQDGVEPVVRKEGFVARNYSYEQQED